MGQGINIANEIYDLYGYCCGYIRILPRNVLDKSSKLIDISRKPTADGTEKVTNRGEGSSNANDEKSAQNSSIKSKSANSNDTDNIENIEVFKGSKTTY